MNSDKGPCDTIRDCVQSILLSVEELCKEKTNSSNELQVISKHIQAIEKKLPPNSSPEIQNIVSRAEHTVKKLAERLQGAGGLTTNFSKQAGKSTGLLETMNLKRGQFQPGLGGPSVMASSAKIRPNAPVGGSWIEKMSQSKKKPYWVSTTNSTKTSWVRPRNAEITLAKGGRRTRMTRKMRSKSRKSRR